MNTKLAYLAGAIDSDGYITIHRRKGGLTERLGLNQVTPQIPELLRECFGGHIFHYASSTQNGKPLYRYDCRGPLAANACDALLPYLLVKSEQAKILVEYNSTRQKIYRKHSYWFKKDHPNWENLELITTEQAAEIIGYTDVVSVGQAIRAGTLLAIAPSSHKKFTPRIPRLMADELATYKGSRIPVNPAGLTTWRKSLYLRIRELNHTGTTVFDQKLI